jgi:hypothetical protein
MMVMMTVMTVMMTVMIVMIVMIIRKNNYERNIINLVLSKLDYSPKHYKIIKKDNKIFIKCHYYTTNNSHLIFNGSIINKIKHDSNDNYYITTYTKEHATSLFLTNYDKNKELGIITFDIMIDFISKNYKIINSYFQIINCIKDDDNIYTKLITYLQDPTFYINVNYIYDNNLNIYNHNLNSYNELFYKQFGKREQLYRFNYMEKFNIIITNDKNRIVITPILNQIRKKTNLIIEISNIIDIKPHINNNIAVKIISGIFI